MRWSADLQGFGGCSPPTTGLERGKGEKLVKELGRVAKDGLVPGRENKIVR